METTGKRDLRLWLSETAMNAAYCAALESLKALIARPWMKRAEVRKCADWKKRN